MLIFILKKIFYLKNKQVLDARFWIQKALLAKSFKQISF
jgi:hypothetical protein|tara:strand:+ start:248 stop:364 length:117 start_codon:yes stop_codon:yes gene_type:complete